MAAKSLTAGLVKHGSSPTRLKEIESFLEAQGVKISKAPDYRLHCHSDRLLLEDCQHPDQLVIQVDFSNGKMQWRRKQSERLHRAVGISKQRQPTIVDATAGLGRDAYVMANQGSQVTLLENNPLVYLILQDGINQAIRAGESAVKKMTVIFGDANAYLSTLSEAPQVIYLDPMFPLSKKSAKTKKEMQLLHTLVGKFADNPALLELARATAINRVVVKRPVKALAYAEVEPDFSISGKNIRYDVYSKRAFI